MSKIVINMDVKENTYSIDFTNDGNGITYEEAVFALCGLCEEFVKADVFPLQSLLYLMGDIIGEIVDNDMDDDEEESSPVLRFDA